MALSGLWLEVNLVPSCLGCVPWNHCWGHRMGLYHMLLAHMLLCNLNVLQLTEHKQFIRCVYISVRSIRINLNASVGLGVRLAMLLVSLGLFTVFGLDHYCTDIQHIGRFSDSRACQRTLARVSSWRHACYINVCMCMYAYVSDLLWLVAFTLVVKVWAGSCLCSLCLWDSRQSKSLGSLKEFEWEIKGWWGPWADGNLSGRFFFWLKPIFSPGLRLSLFLTTWTPLWRVWWSRWRSCLRQIHCIFLFFVYSQFFISKCGINS